MDTFLFDAYRWALLYIHLPCSGRSTHNAGTVLRRKNGNIISIRCLTTDGVRIVSNRCQGSGDEFQFSYSYDRSHCYTNYQPHGKFIFLELGPPTFSDLLLKTILTFQGEHMLVLPLMIMGGVLTLGGIASLFLPETKGRPLPQTLEDGESVFVGICSCCKPLAKTTSVSTIAVEKENEIQNNDDTRKAICSICQGEIKNRTI